MKLLKFEAAEGNNLAQELRTLANSIEKGIFGDAHNLAWVINKGNGQVEVGLLGNADSAGPEAYYLLALGQHRFFER